VTKLIFWLAALVAVLAAMVNAVPGVPGGVFWLAAVVAALIMVRRSWPKRTDPE